MERIYLDHAGATPLLPEALHAMSGTMVFFGNPGAIHTDGVNAKGVLTRAREGVARILGCKAREIVFTSGGTECNNLAILGFARTFEDLKKTHWIVSSIEHPSVLECFAEIERLGGAVTFVDPDARGIITPEAVRVALRPETVFLSIGWASGEIGVVQPLAEIARVCSAANSNSIFHSDGGQAPLYLAATVHSLGVDMLTLDAAKLYGPRGIGALYLSNRVRLAPILFGGKQERGLRPGTENVALVAGFAAAFERIAAERSDEARRLEQLRDAFARDLLEQIPSAIINGDLKHALPHMLNISIPNINSEYITLQLDHAGISISTKSACREGETSLSHVVEALGGEPWRARNTLRLSLGRDTATEQLKRVIAELVRVI